jgi:P4 family phage/plasmid primase-like protien
MNLSEYYDFVNGDILELRPGSKMPKDFNWPIAPSKIPGDQAENYLTCGTNLGYRIPIDILVIDVDTQNGGDKSFLQLPQEVQELPQTTLTPSGGFHIYTQLPEGVDCKSLKSTHPEFSGIDFLHQGKQVVCPGSERNDREMWQLADTATLPPPATPESLLTRLERPAPPSAEESKRGGYVTNIELAKILKDVPVEDFNNNSEWQPMMFACHDATQGCGFEAFIAWCVSDKEFAGREHEIRKRWDSATEQAERKEPSITIRTLCSILGKYRSGAPEWLLIRAGVMANNTDFFDSVQDANSVRDEFESLKATINRESDSMVLLQDTVVAVASSSLLNEGVKDKLYRLIAKRADVSVSSIAKTVKGLVVKRGNRISTTAVGDPGSILDDGNLQELDDSQVQLVLANRTIHELTMRHHGVSPIYTCGQWWMWSGHHWEGTTAEQNMKQLVMQIMTTCRVTVTAKLIDSILDLMKISREVGLDRITPDVNVFRVYTQSTVVDLDKKTGVWEKKKHNHTYGNNYVLATMYDDSAGEPKQWLKFLSEVMTSVHAQRTLACAIAYAATGCRPFLRKAFYMYGPKRSGKSTALDLIESLIGQNNASSLNIVQVGTRFGSSGLMGKLVNISNETVERKSIEDDIFKALVSGESITVERKYADSYSMNNIAKLFFASNNFPHIRDESEAVWDRLAILSFPRYFPEAEADIDLKDKLLTERRQILKWALDIFAEEYRKDKCISAMKMDEHGEEVMRKWREINNPPLEWAKERVIEDGESSINVDQCFEDYLQWCRDNGHRSTSKNHFSRHIRKLMVGETTGSYGLLVFPGRTLRARHPFNATE